MHPPFFVPDLRIGAPDDHSAPPPRRHRPGRLILRPVSGPPRHAALAFDLALTARVAPAPLAPARPVLLRDALFVVPPPTRSLRDRLGRWLIRRGQLMLRPAAAGN